MTGSTLADVTVLAGSATGLVRGERAGGRWDVERVLDGHDVRALAADAETLYAGTDGGGVWRSDDRGRSWTRVGLEDERIRSLAAAQGRLYAGTKPARVWVSASGGERWEPLAPFPRWRSWFWWSPAEKPHTAYVQTLSVSPSDPQVVLAGIEAGALVRSADGGRTWSGHLRRASRDPHVVSFHPVDGSWAYEGGGTGAAISRDGGRKWQKVSAGLDRRYCWAVAADPGQPERWYVAAARGPRQAHGGGHAGAAILHAKGDRWTIVADDLPAMPYLLSCPASNQVVAVLGNGEMRITRDAGDSWETLPLTPGGIRTALLLT
jgi:photosystem II stability/assembly factor-like uncharacterized protein